MDIFDTNFLAFHEMELRHELEEVLNHEEIFWKQKSRCDWLHLGTITPNFFILDLFREERIIASPLFVTRSVIGFLT